MYSNYGDVRIYEDDLIKQIGKKYVGNNNFEMTKNGKCGLDLENEKIFKCPDNQYCNQHSMCTTYNNDYDYDNYNNIDLGLDLPDLKLNLIHGNKFNEDYNKWYDNRKQKIQSISNKYINNNFEPSTNGTCGIDLENQKIFKCSDNQYCNNNINKCSTDYNYNIDYQKINFNNKYLNDLSSNRIYLKKNNLSSKQIFLQDETNLKDLNSNLMHGDKFNEQYDKWLDDRIDKSVYYLSNDICGKKPELGRLYKCINNDCCINNECKSGEICKNADSNSKFHGKNFLIENTLDRQYVANLVSGQNIANTVSGQNEAQPVILDCNNSKLLDSLKTYYYEIFKSQNDEYKIVEFVKTNKIDDNTCDIKFNFEHKRFGKTYKYGQSSRRFTFQYYPDNKNWLCTFIGDPYSGVTTLPLDIVFPITTIVYIAIAGSIVLLLFIYIIYNMYNNKKYKLFN